ncbi:MAG TPA: RES family NAD+ phosphorylase [Ferrovibrio sp.]|uniref:RES family NAD+ phosphorylase n=1 Tax=Ferrovibrio sp. TaxID=1917215 RepID=UPI002ED0B9EE
MKLPVTNIAEPNTVRLIPTGRLKGPILAALVRHQGDLDDLAELESATNDRLIAENAGMPELRREDLIYSRPYRTFINAAFAHTRPGGNRFNSERRGAWYCALEIETSLAEIAFHLTRELINIGRFDNRTDYTELFAGFIGPFHDLRGTAEQTCLDPDPSIGYPAGQALAAELIAQGGNGLLYPSARRPEGTCLVAFHPHLVQDVRPGAIWRLEWAGSPEPTIYKA